ncbi:MAG: glycoside hydrolase family 127 protein [Promethearchaeota archaeon]
MHEPPFSRCLELGILDVKLMDKFWAPRQDMMISRTLVLQHEMLEKYHAIENFRIASGLSRKTWFGMFYYDADVYKWIEATVYHLSRKDDKNLRERLENVVSYICKSQLDDGYINTFFTVNFPSERMKNLLIFHELFCAGHLIEAAVARKEVMGKDDLLKVAVKFVKFLKNYTREIDLGDFLPGHEEIELALVRLYRVTGNNYYLELSKDLVYKRGVRKPSFTRLLKSAFHAWRLLKKQERDIKKQVSTGNYDDLPDLSKGWEASSASLMDYLRFLHSFSSGKYSQQHRPLKEQRTTVGHAVRGTYFFSAATDIYLETGDKTLLSALIRLWREMTDKRMYVTGGIGSVPIVEGWGKDFELKNDKAYCETCAAIGNFFWNWRLLLATGDARHSDLMELILYNALLPGISLDGTKYSYSNPLEVKTKAREKRGRKEWFTCACCPPNIARVIGSLGKYIYTLSRDKSTLHVEQYIGSELTLMLEKGDAFHFKMESGFPWSFHVRINFLSPLKSTRKLAFRIPAWSISLELLVNNCQVTPPSLDQGKKSEKKGYIIVNGPFKIGDEISINFSARTRWKLPDPRVKANKGRVAILRGPLVYCVESADINMMNVDGLVVDRTMRLEETIGKGILEHVVLLSGKAFHDDDEHTFMNFTAVPYFAWNNRGNGTMQIWLREKRKKR